MNAIVSQIARRTSLSTLAALALAAASSSAVSAQNAAKMEVWTVNMAKSTFNSTSGTLVLEQSKAAPDVDAKGYPAAHTFLLLSSGKLYLATEDASTVNSTNSGVYSRWAGMKLSQVGQVTSGYACGFRCQWGLPDNRPMTMRVVFNTTSAIADAMRRVNVLALDRR